MKYRRFGKLDWQASALGFGCGRLPRRDEEHKDVDETEAVRMLRYAIDQGVNYLDTAYNYHGGQSERVVGLALQDGYRDKVKLATKLFWPEVHVADDFDRLLNEQLGRLQTDHVDLYLLHGLSSHADSWPKLRDLGVLKWAEGVIADGRIGCLGFSFHDCLDVFQEIIDLAMARERATCVAVGELRRAQGRTEQAQEAYRQARAIIERVASRLTDGTQRETILNSTHIREIRQAAWFTKAHRSRPKRSGAPFGGGRRVEPTFSACKKICTPGSERTPRYKGKRL